MSNDESQPWYKNTAFWAGGIIAAAVLGYYIKKYMGEKKVEREATTKQLSMIESELAKMGGADVVVIGE
jgi:uncharacterized membrane protein YdjX (TVP38/TMEM64 family)